MRGQRKWLALALSVVMLFGVMAVPSQAAGVSGLTPAEAAAYLKVLNSPPNARYSYLEDLNGDRKPELITADIQSDILKLEIWTIRNGAAVRLATHDLDAGIGGVSSDMGIARSSGQVRLYEAGISTRMMQEWYTFLNLDGTVEEHSGVADPGDSPEIVSPLEEMKAAWESESLFNSAGGSWYVQEDSRVNEGLQAHTEQESSAASGNGTYTVQYYEASGNKITVTFETTSVEKCTVLYSDDGHYDNEADGAPKPTQVTMVSVRPGSTITITGSQYQMDGRTYIFASAGSIDGNNCFLSRQSAFELFSGPVQNSFPDTTTLWALLTTDNDGDPIYLRLGEDAGPGAGGFLDVKESDYYAAPVAWAVEQGITTGTSANTFSPTATCTTGQILTFLWRASGSPKVSADNAFSDVSAGDYYYQAALWANEKGLVSGATFQGNTPCTRAETVTYLWKLADRPTAGGASFTDVPSDASYAKAVSWAVKEGITSGTGSNAFSPNSTCTRGQIVTFLYRTMA